MCDKNKLFWKNSKKNMTLTPVQVLDTLKKRIFKDTPKNTFVPSSYQISEIDNLMFS